MFEIFLIFLTVDEAFNQRIVWNKKTGNLHSSPTCLVCSTASVVRRRLSCRSWLWLSRMMTEPSRLCSVERLDLVWRRSTEV